MSYGYALRREHKYGAKRTLYNGEWYDSKKEAAQAAELDLRVRAKDIHGYERQVKFDLEVRGVIVARYVADFLVHHHNGNLEVVEVKGMHTPVWKLKKKMFEALYKNYKLTVV